MRLKALIPILSVSLMLGACDQQSKQQAVAAAATASTAPGEALLSRIGSLEGQRLADGECGLFLWSRQGNQRVFALFQRSSNTDLLMQIDGQQTRFMRTSGDGRSFFGIQEHQIAKSGDLTAELTFAGDAISAIAQGLQVGRASLKVTAENGWDVAMPVAGLISCQKAAAAG